MLSFEIKVWLGFIAGSLPVGILPWKLLSVGAGYPGQGVKDRVWRVMFGWKYNIDLKV